MDHISIVVTTSKRYEAFLSTHFTAEGDGLGQKFKSIKEKIPRRLYSSFYYLISVRNDLIHNPQSNTLPDPEQFRRVINYLENGLEPLIPGHKAQLLTASAFVPPNPEERIVYVHQPSPPKIVRLHRFEPLAKVGFWLLVFAVVCAPFAGGFFRTHDSSYSSGGIFGIGQDHCHTSTQAPTIAFYLAFVAIIVLSAAFAWHYLKRWLYEDKVA